MIKLIYESSGELINDETKIEMTGKPITVDECFTLFINFMASMGFAEDSISDWIAERGAQIEEEDSE